MSVAAEIVSSDSEELILVNADDEVIGSMAKRDCHLDDGILHRAFSIFILNRRGDVLLQQRSSQKMLWGGYWSNACCSHPRVGEEAGEAARRRLLQELGITAELTFLYKFQYQAPFDDIGSENELCWVWVGFAEEEDIVANPNEIADWRFFSRDELNRELKDHPDRYTPWMKMEWQRLLDEHETQLTP